MINLYAGDIRSGKSHSVVEFIIIPALKAGRTVATNIPLTEGYDTEYLITDHYPEGKIHYFESKEPLVNDKLNYEFFPNEERFPKGTVFVIDECWRYWPAGLRNDQVPTIGKEFFTESGHVVGDDGYTNEIILVTQDATQIASFVTVLLDNTYYTTKISGAGKTLAQYANTHVYAGKYTKGLRGKTVLSSTRFKYRNDIYQYYISHTKGDGKVGIEDAIDGRNNFMRSFIKTLIFCGIVVGLSFWIFKAWSTQEAYTGKSASSSSGETVKTVSKTVERIEKSSSFDLPTNLGLKISGVASFGGNTTVFLEDNAKTPITSKQLKRSGYAVKIYNNCHILLTDSYKNELDIFCSFPQYKED